MYGLHTACLRESNKVGLRYFCHLCLPLAWQLRADLGIVRYIVLPCYNQSASRVTHVVFSILLLDV